MRRRVSLARPVRSTNADPLAAETILPLGAKCCESTPPEEIHGTKQYSQISDQNRTPKLQMKGDVPHHCKVLRKFSG